MLHRRPDPVFIPASKPDDCLVVLFHGCTWTIWRRKTQLTHIIDAVRESLPGADILMPVMPIEFWSLQNPDHVVEDVIHAIDGVWTRRAGAGRQYRRIVMIGFSFGSVLLRQVFCRAAGAEVDATVVPGAARTWSARVERVILLAGLNRGWTVDSPVTRIESLFNNIGTAIGHVLPRKPTLFAIRRGAPFLTRTRLQWLALERHALTPPLTVQLLGTRDDIVSPVDNIDLATGRRFVYLEVPESGHFDVIHMARKTPIGTKRRQIFQHALTTAHAAVRASGITEHELLQLLPIGADPIGELARRASDGERLDDVLFVVHGIRDKGFWTRKIARVVVSYGRAQRRNIVAIAPTYGYLAMLPFLLPWTRRAKVEWLLDIYVAVRCWHPDAAVSFIGHSNGTYIVSGAIESCPAVCFNHLVFAGSVVRSNFEWDRYVGKQVSAVMNYVATADWVVAVFPRFFQLLRLQDLGSSGHDGFTNESKGFVTDVEYVAGSHSAALDEQHWHDIAKFVIEGTPPGPRVLIRNVWVASAGYVTPVIWALLAVAAASPIYLCLTALGFPELTGWSWVQAWLTQAAPLPAWLWATALLTWLQVLKLGLTRL